MSSLVSHLDADCQKAVHLARLALPEGERLDVPRLLDALYHATALHDDPALHRMAGLLPPPPPPALHVMAGLFPPPTPLHESPPPAPVDGELKRILVGLRHAHPNPVTPMEL